MNKIGAVKWALTEASVRSTGWCAKFVRRALMFGGGIPLKGWPGHAFEYNPYLLKYGFKIIPNAAPLELGDIAVFQNTAWSKSGHIQIYTGEAGGRWVSDFLQRSTKDFPANRIIWPGMKYENAKTPYVIFRHGA